MKSIWKVLRNIEKVTTKKASQFNNAKYINKFSDVFTPVITDDYNNCVYSRNVLKLLKSSLHIRRTNLQKILSVGQLVYFPIYLKFMKDLCMIIWVITLTMFIKISVRFPKGFRTQNYLLCIIDTIRKACENHGIFPAVMTTYLKPLFAFPTNF